MTPFRTAVALSHVASHPKAALLPRILVATAAAGLVVALAGCSPGSPAAAVAAVNDKVYVVTPDAIKVKSGLITGDLTELKITERVEDGTGRVVTAARLTGKLVLKNTSTDQSLRLVDGKFAYLDAQGKPMKLEDNRTEPALKMAASYGTPDRMDPGQEMTQSIETEFPVAALKAGAFKSLRLDLTYLPTAFKAESLNFGLAIGKP